MEETRSGSMVVRREHLKEIFSEVFGMKYKEENNERKIRDERDEVEQAEHAVEGRREEGGRYEKTTMEHEEDVDDDMLRISRFESLRERLPLLTKVSNITCLSNFSYYSH